MAIKILKDKIDFNVTDARCFTKHGTYKFEILDDKIYSLTSAFDISLLKRKGKCPSYKPLYILELIELVRKIYADDIELYSKYFDCKDLLLLNNFLVYLKVFIE